MRVCVREREREREREFSRRFGRCPEARQQQFRQQEGAQVVDLKFLVEAVRSAGVRIARTSRIVEEDGDISVANFSRECRHKCADSGLAMSCHIF